MLATLNLQLSPVELHSDTNLTPLAAPGETGELQAGFADVLRLRADAAPATGYEGGELLPEDGSELPGIAELVLADDVLGSQPMYAFDPDLWTPNDDPGLEILMPIPVLEAEPGIHAEAADLLLETPVVYPPPISDSAMNLESLILAPPLTSATPLSAAAAEDAQRLETGTRGWQSAASDLQLRLNAGQGGAHPAHLASPAIDARDLLVRNKVGDVVVPGANLGLREIGQPAKAATQSPISVADATLQMEQRMPLTELAGRLELTALRRADARGEPTADTLRARIAAPQVSQNSQAQISPPSSQPTLSLAPSAASDAGLALQGTDLISTSVRDSAWGQQIGERVVMMAGNQLKQAEIRLTPAELGPLRVQISVDDGAAHVTFHAQHAVTREALEQAMPRLREMFAENGLSLGQADVSDRGVGDGNRERESDGRMSNPVAEDLHDASREFAGDSSRRQTTTNGLVDTFA